MTTVYNEIDKVGGDPLHRFVKVELVWDQTLSPIAMVMDSKVMVGAASIISSNAHGEWEMELVPNADVTPAGSVYRVSHMENAVGGSTVSYYVLVQDSPDRIWAGDIVVPKPEWLS